MDLIDDELVLNIASYCDARSMLSLALTSKKYGSKPSTTVDIIIHSEGARRATIKRSWSLMDEAARRIVWKFSSTQLGSLGMGMTFDGLLLEKNVTYKMTKSMMLSKIKEESLTAEMVEDCSKSIQSKIRPFYGRMAPREEMSWMGLLYQMVIARKGRMFSIDLHSLMTDEDVMSSYKNCRRDPGERINGQQINGVTKLELRGPEWNEFLPHDDEGQHPSSPDANIERLFRDIATLPQLREIVIDPSFNSQENQQLNASFVVWLLSPQSKYTTLRINNLDVMFQEHADKLTEAFNNCTSIESLCISVLYIGSRVTNIIPLMQSIANMPKLTHLRLVMVAFNVMGWNPEPPGVGINYAEDSLQALQSSTTLENLQILTGDEVLGPVMGQYFSRNNLREISNCRSLNADL